MISGGDTAWVLMSTALVMLMTPGLAFFYSGLVPARNALNTIKMSFICLAIIPLIWAVFGYSLVYSPGNSFIGGFDYIFLEKISDTLASGKNIHHYAYMTFQMMFAVITPAIISGAVVGRMRFKAYCIFIALWSIIVYMPLAHWVWGPDGWIANLGAIDFAGGIVVHISSGFSAMVAAIMLGPRIVYKKQKDEPHNIPFVILGASLLWFGWFGFNAGSSLAADKLASIAMVTTILATSASITTWNLLAWMRVTQSSTIGSAVAAVVGLVAITPAAGYVTPVGAIIIGMVAAITVQLFLLLLKNFNKIDDTADVFVCHGIGGIVGTLMTGLLATTALNTYGKNGLIYGNPELLLAQFIAVLAAIAIAVIGTALILFVMKKCMSLRPTPKEELQGIDIVEHGETAYHNNYK